jgi:hypothetical protein
VVIIGLIPEDFKASRKAEGVVEEVIEISVVFRIAILGSRKVSI